MARTQTLPLGIDVGSTHVRVALAVRTPGGGTQLVAVAARPVTDLRGTAQSLAEAIAELATRERRCVVSVSEPAACLRATTFPPMPAAENERAARFAIARFAAFPIDEADVRVEPLSARRFAVGAIHKPAIAALRLLARRTHLRLLAIDHDAFALRRACPNSDAILDIGRDRARLYVFGSDVPQTHVVDVGGEAFTGALRDAFGMDRATAEHRKHTYGLGDVGAGVRERLTGAVADALIDVRADGFADVRSLTLTGNGARGAELAGALASACGIDVTLAAIDARLAPAIPPDVVRAASPDWALAWGCAQWPH